MTEQLHSLSDGSIAIVGMSCRLPGARNIEEFWRNLAGGVESITRLSDEEILESGVPRSSLTDPNYVKAAPILEEPGGFDAGFFGFSPMEARTMDPQHRILLELAYEALEDAGCDSSVYPGRIGVFTGAAMNTYFTSGHLDRKLAKDYIPTLIANDKDFLSTRISYKLNLKGPSITIQTACSTSLVAIHLACQSLLSEETDMALAGAMSVRVPHRAGYFFDGGGVVSPDGRVRAFNAGANGTVFGSGGGIVVLKRLSDAIADGDVIHALIRGSAVNNDGAEKAGYTAPSVNSQAEVVVEALANAGIDGNSISYVEAHGSGTPVGDPIEIMALTKAFRTFTKRSGYCAIGSVKTNIGHIDAAAGIAGLIKTVLALKHRELPASLHYTQPNPELDFPATPFFVNTSLAPWISNGPRRAGIMATGMGGTNAHIVLEEALQREEPAGSGLPQLLVLSARTPEALDLAAARLVESLKNNVTAGMDDVAFTLQTGRRHFAHRRFVVSADRNDAMSRLEDTSNRTNFSKADESTHRPLILLLPGIGDLYVGAAHGLYEHFAVFREEVARCAQILEPYLGVDIRQILYPQNGDWREKQNPKRGIDLQRLLAGNFEAETPESRKLNHILYAQPALFTIEYALARLWNDLGVVPDAIVGHSMGEYVAACLAGVLSLEDALRLIVRRTQLVERLPEGRMLAVNLSEEEITKLLNENLSISLINGPSVYVVAGPAPAVDDFGKMLAGRGVICRPVQNTHAFHSRMLDPIVSEFEDEVRKVQLHEPRIPFMSNVTGSWISKEDAVDPAYWGRHTNHTARFNEALHTLWQFQDAILVEAGPGRTLGVLAMQHPDRQNAGSPSALASVRHHYENREDAEVLMHNVGRLWLAGVRIHWENLHQRKARRKTSLPTYPFERQTYWLEPSDGQTEQPTPDSAGLARAGLENWFYVPSWHRTPFHPDPAIVPASGNGISWLIFTDRWGEGAGFRKKLEELGSAVQVARFGDEFARENDGTFEINPASLEDYLNLFRELMRTMGSSLHIVHMGCLTAEKDSQNPFYRADSQNFGFYSLLYIAQAIGELNISVPVRIGILSNRLHEITGDEALNPEMIPAVGLSGVIAKEFPNISSFNVDLPGPMPVDTAAGGIVNRILAEFAQPSQSDVIGYRGKYRWTRTWAPIELPQTATSTNEDLLRLKRLRHRGVYLITGGTGGIGLVLARYLANTCHARLVLTRKSAFPERSAWTELLAADNGSKQPAGKITVIIRAILEIETLGSDVEVFAADVSDREQMRQVMDETVKRFGPINGVIHAAGVVRPGMIQSKTRAAAEAVLTPKVQGTAVLFDLLKETPPDFLVLVSSLASVTAPYAHSDYSAANAFLDAFASYSNATGKFHTLTINWPVWKEAGIVAELQSMMGVENWKEEALEKGILTSEGLETFERALNSDLPQVIVSPENLHLLLRESEEMRPPVRTLNEERALLLDDAADDEIEMVVTGMWSSTLGLEQIGIHDEFFTLGGHSLMAMQIVAKVRATYPVEFTLRNFFEAPTIARLSSSIRQKLIAAIEAMSDTEAQRLTSSTGDQF